MKFGCYCYTVIVKEKHVSLAQLNHMLPLSIFSLSEPTHISGNEPILKRKTT